MITMLQDINAAEFDTVYKIMQDSFPPDERRTYEGQKALLSKKTYRIKVLRGQEGDIEAFIAFYVFDKFVFVEHFAVSSAHRNKGLGAVILQELMAEFGYPVCLEVEPPDTDLAKRRIEFYKRNSFVLNDYPYIQPPLGEGKKPLPLKIMSSKNYLDKDEFETVKGIIYKEVYNKDAD